MDIEALEDGDFLPWEDPSESTELLMTREEIMKWKVDEMKQWLAKRRKPRSGLKPTLCSRILRHMAGFSSDEDESDDSDISDDDEVPDTSYNTRKILQNPTVLTQPDAIPNLREEDITNYYVHGRNPLTGHSKKLNRYLKKARKFSEERNYIGTITYEKEDDKIRFVCSVKPSMKKGRYLVTALLYSDTAMVVGGECGCKVGLIGYCAHIGGLLFRLVHLKNSCTSKLCEWNQPTLKEVEPQLLKSINWRPGKDEAQYKPWSDDYQAGPCKKAEEHDALFCRDLLQSLKEVNKDCALFQSLQSNPCDINDFIEIYDPGMQLECGEKESQLWMEDHLDDYMDSLEITPEMSSRVEKATRGQSLNPNWKKARQCIITASNFGKILHLREKTNRDNTVKFLLGYSTVPTTMAMQYGIKKEIHGRKRYIKNHIKDCDSKAKVMTAGLVVSCEWPFLGASMDGLMTCPTCGTVGLEIKCTYKFRNFDVKSMAEDPTSCLEVIDGDVIKLKRNHTYYDQVQGQMAVTGLDKVDFIIYTKKSNFVERIDKDASWVTNNVPKLKQFYRDHIVKEILTRRIMSTS